MAIDDLLSLTLLNTELKKKMAVGLSIFGDTIQAEVNQDMLE